jgi:hypothetical protein
LPLWHSSGIIIRKDGGEIMSIVLEVPETLLEELRQKALSEEKSLEEIGLEALLAHAGLEDPGARSEIHFSLSQKYLREAKELVMKEDWVQAAEKGWGAASQMVKAVAAKRGRELRSHSELNEYLDELCEEMKAPELDRLWSRAIALHQNFYESWLPPRSVKRGIEDVEEFTQKLSRVI